MNILLNALECQSKDIEYYALDVNLSELQRTLAAVPKYNHVKCFGLLGTYDDGLVWLKTPHISSRVKIVMSMGSSIGNFDRRDAARFLDNVANAMGESGSILIGIDSCQDSNRVYKAYNDCNGTTHMFTLNGLKHANKLLEREEFDLRNWQTVGRYNQEKGCHQAFVTPRYGTSILDIPISAGELIRIEESFKYSEHDMSCLWKEAQLTELNQWYNKRGDYGKWA